MATVELYLFAVTDPLTGARRRTTYRLTVEEARERYVDPEVLPWSREVRECSARTHLDTASTLATRPSARAGSSSAEGPQRPSRPSTGR